jgi:hypothetical protein
VEFAGTMLAAISPQFVEDRMSIHSVVSGFSTPANTKQNPTQAARAAIADRPDLANQPFGKLVSEFARGIPLPPSSATDNSAATLDPNAPPIG